MLYLYCLYALNKFILFYVDNLLHAKLACIAIEKRIQSSQHLHEPKQVSFQYKRNVHSTNEYMSRESITSWGLIR